MTPQQKEDLRHVVLEILVIREGTALTAHRICRIAANEVDFEPTDEDVVIVLKFLNALDPKLVAMESDPLGSTIYWQATPAGVLAQERGRI